MIVPYNKEFQADPDNNKKKYFITFPFPYVNGAPHLGHGYTLLRCDMVARYKKLRGYNTLLPIGFHATGEPIMGAAKRIAKKDKKIIQSFKKYGLNEGEIQELSDPKKMIQFFIKQWIETINEYKIGHDSRRYFHTTSLNPEYNAYVTWQYNKLREKGLIKRGNHPVIWCPADQSPTGSHDRQEGENAIIIEYTLIKFKTSQGTILPCATLRPETVYGVTNLWVNPEKEYVKAQINDEEWITSQESLIKLEDQDREVIVKEKLKGEEIVGLTVKNPVTGEEVEILPAKFVKTSTGTGVVMSVPSHAPYDYAALRDIGFEFTPKQLIKTPGLPKNPGIELVEKEKVKDQEDVEKLDALTKHVYKQEYHKGVLTKECKQFAGKPVKEAKKQIIKQFEKNGWSEKLYETSEPVVCRCMTSNHVKLLKNQWFLKYSDPKWKKKTLQALKKMTILPEEARNLIKNSIENMEDKACARKSGLGTPLPWDPEWIVETLSDSTMYMPYYIIAKYVNQGLVKHNNLTPEFFDYVLLSEGNINKVSEKTKLSKELIKKIKEEFEYYYPLDMRVTAKDLLPHHIPFFIYHHTAFFKQDKWPKSVAANGWVLVEGEKMSKSKGNFVTLREAIKTHGTDAVRLALLDTAEGLDDPDFREKTVETFNKKMENALKKQKTKGRKGKKNGAEKLLLSKMQTIIQKTGEHLEKMENRQALKYAFHDAYNALNEYLQMVDSPHEETLKQFYQAWSIIINPFAPGFSEKINPHVYEQKWPKPNKKLINKKIEQYYEIVKNMITDYNKIKKLTKNKKTRTVKIIISEEWKYEFYKKLKKLIQKRRDYKTLFEKLRVEGKEKEINKLIMQALKDETKIPNTILNPEQEIKAFKTFKNYLEKNISAGIIIERGDDSEEEKKSYAQPSKPALILEQE